MTVFYRHRYEKKMKLRKRIAQAVLRNPLKIMVLTGVLLLFGVPQRPPGFCQTPGFVEPLPASPEDAQSTTGPTPPPWVLRERAETAPAGLLAPVLISGVPFYLWRDGCGPTAAGMVLGYWDGQGFDFLIPGDAQSQTPDVDAMIATEGPASNYTDYCEPIDSFPTLKPDLSENPPGDEHPNNCVADYMLTSQSAHNNYYGWGWASNVGPAMKSYVDALGIPDLVVTEDLLHMGSSLTWDSFKAEIDAGRPLVFLVDTDGDGSTDHFVTVVGYNEAGTQSYACHDTWDTHVHWYDFKQMQGGQQWGVWGATTFQLGWQCHAYPEAGTPPPPPCAGDEVVLDGSASSATHCSSALEYLWRDGPQTICNWQASPLCAVSPDVTTTYTLRVRCAADIYCRAPDNVQVAVNPLPEASVGSNPLEVCLGQHAELGNGPGEAGIEYQWDPPDYLDNPRTANPIFTAAAVGGMTYTLTATNPVTGCFSQASLAVSVIVGTPSESVGNRLFAAKSGNDVVLFWPALDVRKYNVHSSADEKALDWSNYTAPLLAAPSNVETYIHTGAARGLEPLLFYQVYGRDCDGATILR
jgi:hypothetical protein